MKTLGRRIVFLVFAASAGCAVNVVTAPAPVAYPTDPPGRVARLNFIEGSVSLEPAGAQDWVQANPNRPLTGGDDLWTDAASRGELHIGSTALRLSGSSSLNLLTLNDQTAQMILAQGSLNIHVRRLDANEVYEIDTPRLALTLLRPGEYRVDVDPDGAATTVTVRAGMAEALAGGISYPLNPGPQYVFPGAQSAFDTFPLPSPDDFDSWCTSRDFREDRALSARFVSRDVIGYDDLDAYGAWRPYPGYGMVWVPSRVPPGWAPYRNGHWVNISPWGWTWVEDEPWGFAPFHYGRWVYGPAGWAWVPGGAAAAPGGAIARPVYAPHLVAFVGGGSNVTWVPLGPRDVWVPGYRASAAYVQNANASNTNMINRNYIAGAYGNPSSRTLMNQHSPGAFTAVSPAVFAGGQSVASSAATPAPQTIQRPMPIQSAPAAPTPKSVTGPAQPAKSAPPPSLANRSFVTKLNPPIRAAHAAQPPAQPPKAQPTIASPTRPQAPAAAIRPRPGPAQAAKAAQRTPPGRPGPANPKIAAKPGLAKPAAKKPPQKKLPPRQEKPKQE